MSATLLSIGRGAMSRSVLVTVLLSLALRTFAVEAYAIKERSMLPTYGPGEHIVVDKLTGPIVGFYRGDVVVFQPPHGSCGRSEPGAFIKRVVGLPDEAVELRSRAVFIDGRRLDEPYLTESYVTDPFTSPVERTAWLLAPGEYFVMGDNRGASCDSRDFGPVEGAALIGRVAFRY